MHRTTHERLLSLIWECEDKREAALSWFLAGMMDRYPSLRGDPMLHGLGWRRVLKVPAPVRAGEGRPQGRTRILNPAWSAIELHAHACGSEQSGREIRAIFGA